MYNTSTSRIVRFSDQDYPTKNVKPRAKSKPNLIGSLAQCIREDNKTKEDHDFKETERHVVNNFPPNSIKNKIENSYTTANQPRMHAIHGFPENERHFTTPIHNKSLLSSRLANLNDMEPPQSKTERSAEKVDRR